MILTSMERKTVRMKLRLMASSIQAEAEEEVNTVEEGNIVAEENIAEEANTAVEENIEEEVKEEPIEVAEAEVATIMSKEMKKPSAPSPLKTSNSIMKLQARRNLALTNVTEFQETATSTMFSTKRVEWATLIR